MRETIVQELAKIEQKYNVKVLYACESGSRAWGFPSTDSDYDVRFIYIHRPEWYLSIDEKRDVIEVPIDRLLDINGWDIRKALKLLRKSNPPLQEWLNSSIVYEQSSSVIEKIRELSKRIYSPIACMHHYHHMAKGNYRDYLQGEEVRTKKYFYVLRPLLACKWIEKHGTIPPILFQQLVKELLPNEDQLYQAIQNLLARKLKGEELDREPRIDVINRFIEAELQHIEAYIQTIRYEHADHTEFLDRLFREALQEVWMER